MMIGCNGKKIDVSYCPLCKSPLGRIGGFFAPVFSSQTKVIGDLTSEEYSDIEETTMAYLLKKAIDKAHGRNLLGIAGIKQDMTCNPINNSLEVSLSLRGLAVYSR
jgi:hypothetical protein